MSVFASALGNHECPIPDYGDGGRVGERACQALQDAFHTYVLGDDFDSALRNALRPPDARYLYDPEAIIGDAVELWTTHPYEYGLCITMRVAEGTYRRLKVQISDLG